MDFPQEAIGPNQRGLEPQGSLLCREHIVAIQCYPFVDHQKVFMMLDELEWLSLEARRDRSSLLLFHKIHSRTVSMEKDKYLTPAHSLKSTRSSHSAQYCRYQTYVQ